MLRQLPIYPLFPYTTLFRSWPERGPTRLRSSKNLLSVYLCRGGREAGSHRGWPERGPTRLRSSSYRGGRRQRSEEHTSELQSHSDLVCRLLLEKKKK